MRNIRHRKQTCPAPPAQDEWWALESLFPLSLQSGWVVHCETKTTVLSLAFFLISFCRSLFPSTSDSLHLPLWPASLNVDRDRHMQGGRQPWLASGSGPWQQIPMRADNGARSENNAVCQPRNSACHSGPSPMLGVLHELRWTRKAPLQIQLGFSPLITNGNDFYWLK